MPSRTIFEDVTFDTWVSCYFDTHYVLENPDYELLIAGTAPKMGCWNVWESSARAMDIDGKGLYRVHSWLPIGACVEFKWVVVDPIHKKIVRWCEGRNKVISVPSVGEVRYYVPWEGVPEQTDILLHETFLGKPFTPSELWKKPPPTLLERIGIDADVRYEMDRYLHYFIYFFFTFIFLAVLIGMATHAITDWLGPEEVSTLVQVAGGGQNQTTGFWSCWWC